MSNLQLTQSLKDVLPTHQGPFPPQLVSYVDSLYHLSIQKIPILPHKSDVARYHLCAFLAAERYQDKFSLPAPVSQKIPVQPKVLDRLLGEIEVRVLPSVSSPKTSPIKAQNTSPSRNSPNNSPTKNAPLGSPSKRTHAPVVSSPLKRLQQLQNTPSKTPTNFSQSSPFNPTGSTQLRDEESPFNVKSAKRAHDADETPQKKAKASPQRLEKTPRSSPLKKSASGTPSSPRYGRQLSIADIISFANNFYIPANVTPQLLETFLAERHKFVKKNEWLLACGLIHSAYVRINHRLLQNTVGKKTEFQDQLFQYQKGGLMKWNMVMWLNIVEESVKSEPWAVDLELKFVHNDWSAEDTTREKEILTKLGSGWELYRMLGSMINPSVLFDKPSQEEYYQTWTKRALEKLEEGKS